MVTAHDQPGGGLTQLPSSEVWTAWSEVLKRGAPQQPRKQKSNNAPHSPQNNPSDRSLCRFGDMCKSARCPWYHLTASGTTRQPQGDAGCDMLPPRRRTPAAVSVPAETERARRAISKHPPPPSTRYTEHGSHTRRDKDEHSRQGGGAQRGRRGNQNSGNREPEWSGWESVRMGGSDNKRDGLASQPRLYRVPGQPLLNRHQVGGAPAAQMGRLRNRSGSPLGADQP